MEYSVNEIDVMSSICVGTRPSGRGIYKKGMFKALNVVEKEKPTNGLLLIVLDAELLDISVDTEGLIEFALENIDYLRKKKFVFSIAKHYLTVQESFEHKSLDFYGVI